MIQLGRNSKKAIRFFLILIVKIWKLKQQWDMWNVSNQAEKKCLTTSRLVQKRQEFSCIRMDE